MRNYALILHYELLYNISRIRCGYKNLLLCISKKRSDLRSKDNWRTFRRRVIRKYRKECDLVGYV